jgi:hypothetical protein
MVSNYSVESVKTTQHEFCIYSSDQEYEVFASMEYSGDNFDDRTYYLTNATLTNDTTTVNLYMIEDTLGDEMTFTVQNNDLVTLEGYYVQFNRKDTANATYKTITIGQTDNDGRFTTNIEKGGGVVYQFIVIDTQGTVVDTITPVTFVSTDTTYTITVGADDIFNIYDDLTYSCTYDNSTRILVCTVTDSSGLMTKSRILVQRRITHRWTDLYDNTDTGATVIHTATLTNNVDDYRYFLYANNVLIDSGTIDTAEIVMSPYGQAGLFVVLMLVVVMAFLGINYPGMSMFLTVIAIVISNAINLISISESAVVGIVFVAGIIMIRMVMSK